MLGRASVIDLILIDHKYIKQCIQILGNADAEKRKKFEVARGFLEAIQKHSMAEKKAVYEPASKNEELHFNVLQAEIEHGLVDAKVQKIKHSLLRARSLKESVEAELKVLSDLVKHHLIEEETEILPRMHQEYTEEELENMGEEFMKLRKISPKTLHDFPVLQDELIHWKDSVQELSSKFLSTVDHYVENLKH